MSDNLGEKGKAAQQTILPVLGETHPRAIPIADGNGKNDFTIKIDNPTADDLALHCYLVGSGTPADAGRARLEAEALR
jgi:hypothetical protein